MASWAQDRLGFLNEYFSYSTIRDNTGIPESTISYVIRGMGSLPGKYNAPLASYSNRTIYSLARSIGATPGQASRLRGRSIAYIREYLGEGTELIGRLVDSRFEAQKRIMMTNGTYVNDQDVRDRLTNWIEQGMRAHVGRTGSYFSEDTPSLRHDTELDDF